MKQQFDLQKHIENRETVETLAQTDKPDKQIRREEVLR